MNVEKTLYHNLAKRLFNDPCEVKYWDGEVERYGEGEPLFRIDFNEPLPKLQILSDPSMAFGEAYMHKQVDVEGNLQAAVESIFKSQDDFLDQKKTYIKLARNLASSIHKSKEDVQYHYDIGNDFYRLWLDSTMTYSCAYFESPDDSLLQAQNNKVSHILHKLNLSPGQSLLDIGCGWGELIIAAAKTYGVKALGITLSSEQYAHVQQRIKDDGLQGLVDVQQVDYRELKNVMFDRIVSVGMIEHVGKDYLNTYFSTVKSLLIDGGISLLHCITGYEGEGTNSWIDKYIFPGGYIPKLNELVSLITANEFYLVDLESMREHYTKTLQHWALNFEQSLPTIEKMKDETFIRMWRLYLNSCAASFHCGNIDIHQFLFTKGVNNTLPLTREYMCG